jgi:hypothetical protein
LEPDARDALDLALGGRQPAPGEELPRWPEEACPEEEVAFVGSYARPSWEVGPEAGLPDDSPAAEEGRPAPGAKDFSLVLRYCRPETWERGVILLEEERELRGSFMPEAGGLRFRETADADPRLIPFEKVADVRFRRPEDVNASLGDFRLNRGDLDEALKRYEAALAVASGDPYLRMKVDLARRGREIAGRITEAISWGDHRALVEAATEFIETVGPRRLAPSWKRAFQKAWAHEAADATPEERARWRAAGERVDLKLVWDEEAARRLEQAISLSEAGKAREALKLFTKALQAKIPFDDRSYFLLARTYYELGGRGQAASVLKRVSPAYRSDAEVEALLVKLELAEPSRTQFLLVDAVAIHREDFCTLKGPGPGRPPISSRQDEDAPLNWVEPVNYEDGTYHIRYHVLEKPNKQPVAFHFCWSNFPYNENRFHRRIRCINYITEPGVYTAEGKVKDGSYTLGGEGEVWDWTHAHATIWSDGIRRRGVPQYGPESSYPLKIRVTAWIVAKGARFVPHGFYGDLDSRDIRLLKEVVELLGEDKLGDALVLAEREAEGPDPARAAEARRVVEALKVHAARQKADIAEYKAKEPDLAAFQLKDLARQYLPTELGKELLAQALEWEQDPAAVTARKARRILEAIRAAADQMKKRGEAKGKVLKRLFPSQTRTIVQGASILKNQYAGTSSAAAASALLERLGLSAED